MKKWLQSVVSEYCLRFEEKPPLMVFPRYWLMLKISLAAALASVTLLSLSITRPLPLFYGVCIVLFSISFVTFVFALKPYLKLKDHFEELEKEGLWLATLVKFYSTSGLSPFYLFDLLMKVPFKAIQREARAFLRLSVMYGMDRVKVLMTQLTRIPRGIWYRFLRYIESVVIHGQDSVIGAQSLYREAEVQYKAYLERKYAEFNTLSMGSIALFTLFPLSMLTMATIIASSASFYIATITTIVNIILATVVVFLASKTFGEETLFRRRYIKCTPVLLLPVFVFSLSAFAHDIPNILHISFIILGVTTISSLIITERVLSPQARVIDDMYEHAPMFLGDLLVHMSQGKNIVNATKDVLSTSEYSKHFNIFVNLLIGSLLSNEDVFKKIENQIPRPIYVSFYMCFQAALSGNIPAMTTVIAALRDYCDMLSAIRERLKVLRIVFLVTVIISLGISIYLLKYMIPMLVELSAVVKRTNIDVPLPLDLITVEDLPWFEELISTSLFINFVVGAFVIGGLSSFRFANGIRFAVCISIIVMITFLLLEVM